MKDTTEGFRHAMRRHAASVCIVSVGKGEAVNGMAVTAVTSFSLAPPSLLVCINEGASIARELKEGVAFGVTVLGRDQQEVASAFSRKPNGRERFSHGQWCFRPNDVPWLEQAPANLGCVAVCMLTYGTHRAVIGRVESVQLSEDVIPSLIYRDGVYA